LIAAVVSGRWRIIPDMERTLHIDSPEVDKGLRCMMRVNDVIFCTERDGRYFIDKLKPGTRKEFVTLELPRKELELIRFRVNRGEPLQDYEGLVSIPKRRSQRRPKGKSGRKRG
jgi:hypothetical protein